MKGILLDTHVWIWLMTGDSSLNKTHRRVINEAVETSQIGVPAISLWEISMLNMKGRIRLETPVLTWIQQSLQLPGMHLLPLTPEIASESCQLPDHFHGDPADRLIIATARLHSMTLLTYDERIIDYSQKDYISIVPLKA